MITSHTRAGVKVWQLTIENVGEFQTRVEKTHHLLCGKTDCLHALIVATQRGGVFMSESDGCIAIWCMALI